MTMSHKLIDELLSLPVEERAFIADSLLRSLNSTDPSVDTLWIDVAKKRLEDIHTGKVDPVPGSEVFARILKRYKK